MQLCWLEDGRRAPGWQTGLDHQHLKPNGQAWPTGRPGAQTGSTRQLRKDQLEPGPNARAALQVSSSQPDSACYACRCMACLQRRRSCQQSPPRPAQRSRCSRSSGSPRRRPHLQLPGPRPGVAPLQVQPPSVHMESVVSQLKPELLCPCQSVQQYSMRCVGHSMLDCWNGSCQADKLARRPSQAQPLPESLNSRAEYKGLS